MDIINYIKENFNNDNGFISNNNFEIISLSNEEAKLSYKITDTGLNPQKIVHGGLLFGLADTCAGALACTTGKFPLTTNASINYLRPGTGKQLFAIAKPLKVGKTMAYYTVDIYNDDNKLVATSQVNMFFKEEKNG